MASLALLIGNVEYDQLPALSCCADDVQAIEELLKTSGKYDAITPLLNLQATDLKDRIRNLVDAHPEIEEIFFYFTGHGYQMEGEFFYCATDFDADRPNETGLSNSDLHLLLRAADANLIVKVIDACSSGSLLIKSDGSFLSNAKSSFRNLVQIASCLDSQTSLTGDPLSVFTQQFRDAALSKTEGAVYYSDIVASLRDKFLKNNRQTPHFVFQGTGREQFAPDAHVFDDLRARFLVAVDEQSMLTETAVAASAPMTLLDRLLAAEDTYADRTMAQSYVDDIQSQIESQLNALALPADIFDLAVSKHSSYEEDTAHNFICRVLSRETRPDNFVTASVEIKKKQQRVGGIGYALQQVMGNIYGDEYFEDYELELNAKLERVQIRIDLTPRLKALQRFTLVVSFAPSLDTCYVFEVLTRHSLSDWEKYEAEGSEVKKRWWALDWGSTTTVPKQVTEALKEAIIAHLEARSRATTTDAS